MNRAVEAHSLQASTDYDCDLIPDIKFCKLEVVNLGIDADPASASSTSETTDSWLRFAI